ncbi:pectinesterase [Marchantia polymorpha subsp. ruderalis]|uniref:Pectinesterase n=2 Tax=Marchantia polymorpha TaxID=3197 RepID=A0AAF6BS80_MARPO|nr:hypothetical protein MARPO_0056s0025 [Marchantia polymorpha]BBN14864.1 hypothetical protein Mp_6g15150 [Marchantia polymorpha subsp. ruderalis]|eukprot:PTQ37546.1 hypothetical protein MARPO_0056s0025 [Marchantia polymorpha]
MGALAWAVVWCCCLCSTVAGDWHPLPVTRDSDSAPFESADAGATATVAAVCQATRFPVECSTALAADARSASANSPEFARIALDLGATASTRDLAAVQLMAAGEALDINATAAAAVCAESLDYAVSTLTTARDSLLASPIEDIQSWASAALQFQYDCFSALVNVPSPPADLAATVLPEVNSTMALISIALSITDALAYYGSDATLWLPPPEQRPTDLNAVLLSTSPQWASENGGCDWSAPIDITVPDVTVALDGTGTFTSIQQAVDGAPAFRSVMYIIHIKAGVYSERIRVDRNKTMLMFVGDGANQTVITASKSALEPGVVTYQTATVVVVGKGFVARGITFQNTAGAESRQAVAVRVDADQSAFYDCIFDGFQDTLYAHAGRQFYKSCTIRGTVDFIFGNAAAVFEDCQILLRLRAGNPTSVVTAQGRTDPGQTTGLVFQNCTVSGTPEYMEAFLAEPTAHLGFLGRPWKLFSRTVYVNSFLDAVIEPEGWMPWNGEFALSSLFYGESGSSGPAADTTSRVFWCSPLTFDQAAFFSAANFIQGARWLPCTSVPFTSG